MYLDPANTQPIVVDKKSNLYICYKQSIDHSIRADLQYTCDGLNFLGDLENLSRDTIQKYSYYWNFFLLPQMV